MISLDFLCLLFLAFFLVNCESDENCLENINVVYHEEADRVEEKQIVCPSPETLYTALPAAVWEPDSPQSKKSMNVSNRDRNDPYGKICLRNEEGDFVTGDQFSQGNYSRNQFYNVSVFVLTPEHGQLHCCASRNPRRCSLCAYSAFKEEKVPRGLILKTAKEFCSDRSSISFPTASPTTMRDHDTAEPENDLVAAVMRNTATTGSLTSTAPGAGYQGPDSTQVVQTTPVQIQPDSQELGHKKALIIGLLMLVLIVLAAVFIWALWKRSRTGFWPGIGAARMRRKSRNSDDSGSVFLPEQVALNRTGLAHVH